MFSRVLNIAFDFYLLCIVIKTACSMEIQQSHKLMIHLDDTKWRNTLFFYCSLKLGSPRERCDFRLLCVGKFNATCRLIKKQRTGQSCDISRGYSESGLNVTPLTHSSRLKTILACISKCEINKWNENNVYLLLIKSYFDLEIGLSWE